MQNFIVLGIIPGTNYQLDFGGWLVICSALLVSVVVWRERHTIRSFVTNHTSQPSIQK